MILSHKEIEEIAVAVTKDFNEFFFGPDTDGARLPRGTPIDQFASEYLGLNVSFADLSADGSICGLTAYADTEYIIEKDGMQYSIPLRRNQVLMDASFMPLPRRATTSNTLTCPAVWMRLCSAGASSTRPCRSITSGLP